MRPWPAFLAGLALLGAGVLGYFVYDRTMRPRTVELAGPRADAPSTVRAAPRVPTVVPARRPTFTLKDLAGRTRSIAEWDGRPLMVNFWATWCAPCRREIPLLNRIRREYASKGLEIVGIAVDFGDDVRAFVQDYPVAYPLLVGEEDGLDVARQFGVETMAFPFTVFIDRHARIVALRLGELHDGQPQAILGVVDRVDAGAIAPADAPAAVEAALAALPASGGGPGKRPTGSAGRP